MPPIIKGSEVLYHLTFADKAILGGGVPSPIKATVYHVVDEQSVHLEFIHPVTGDPVGRCSVFVCHPCVSVDSMTGGFCQLPSEPTARPVPDEPAQPVRTYLTLEEIEAQIVKEEYHHFPGTTVTTCLLTLKNTAKVLGFNYGAINPNRQDWKRGREAARQMALDEVWKLEGYLLRQALAAETIKPVQLMNQEGPDLGEHF